MKLIITLLALTITCTAGLCQAPGGMPHTLMAAKDTELMAQRLQLDTAQKRKVATINSQFFEALTATRRSTEQAQTKKQNIETLNRERMEAFKKVLTPQQLAKYQADMEAMRQQIQKKNAELSKKNQLVRPKMDSTTVKH